MKNFVVTALLFVIFINPLFPQINYRDIDAWLPDTIHLALGNTIELYNDNIAFLKLSDTLTKFSWDHAEGTSDDKKFQWTADHTGNINLKIKICNEGVSDSAMTILKVAEKTGAGTLNLLAIGNSLTNRGFEDQFIQISSDLSCSLNPVGTLGTTYKHEGHGGWRFDSFLRESSPFFFTDTVSISKYIMKNNFPDPDVIKISLGINDCYGNLAMDTILTNAYMLIDTVYHDCPNSLIIIALPSSCEKTGSGWLASYGKMDNFERYQLRIRELWKNIHNKYAYGKYKPNIHVSYDGLCIDRTNGFPEDNGVHPNKQGYMQLARGFSNTLNYYLKNYDRDTVKADK